MPEDALRAGTIEPPIARSDNDPIGQTLETIATLHSRAEQRVSTYQRAIETVTAFLGRPVFLYIILIVISIWVVANLSARQLGYAPFDRPPFGWLQGAISTGALLMSTVVLITQNRQAKLAERRAQLDLQINLLAEQKVTKIISLVEELRRDMPNVHNRHDAEAEMMTEASDPEALLVALEYKMDEPEAVKQDTAETIVEEEASVVIAARS